MADSVSTLALRVNSQTALQNLNEMCIRDRCMIRTPLAKLKQAIEAGAM